jgi:ATP-dependent helicase/nuclease subunit A
MAERPAPPPPPDQAKREIALDPRRSILVQAPAGSGKTTLLADRFLRLLAEVEEPGQVVAITFTIPAAAEMRNRILDELRKEEPSPIARRVLEHSTRLGWNLLDQSSQLRISTIDAFCRVLALQQPLLSGLGGGLEIGKAPGDLYRRAARRTLQQIGGKNVLLNSAIARLLLWRDNNWQETEKLLILMLEQRDRWMHDFVLGREPDWDGLREKLERPFAEAARQALTELSRLLDQVPGASEEVLALARFGCEQSGGALYRDLAELVCFPALPFGNIEELEEARHAFVEMAELVLTDSGFRRRLDKRQGFPADCKREKQCLMALIERLSSVPGFETALQRVGQLPPSRYPDEEWELVRASFVLLVHAAAQLKIVFAETGTADFIEVAQIAGAALLGDEDLPSEAAISMADGIRHMLVDEFQDTSRRQHELLSRLIAAWPEREGRTCFVVGDPMQSIYFFRDADAELFPQVQKCGLNIPNDQPLLLETVKLTANFRTAPGLVAGLNERFRQIFATDDGGGIEFTEAEAARSASEISVSQNPDSLFQLHLAFIPQTSKAKSSDSKDERAIKEEKLRSGEERAVAKKAQTDEIVDLIRGHLERVPEARAKGEKLRIAVLARTRKSLAEIAVALREAEVPFLAVDLEALSDRPEVLDALALGRALLNPEDRVAWMGLLRAPWCGLTLADLHTLVSGDDKALLERPVAELIAERSELLSDDGRMAVRRVLAALAEVPRLRFAQPSVSLGTWLEQVWLRLGGDACVDATARANVELLWNRLDGLSEGEQDLLGPAFNAALKDLKALPDPRAESDYGVQLMTIHKAKGLEFEVVIVPDLQAGAGRQEVRLLSWMERGLPEPDESGEITEFLVAPIQPKGAEGGSAKKWVDVQRRNKERQEMRRLLYVAATRAREELHLFARPGYKQGKDAGLELAKPAESLLGTAWPALEAEVREQFAQWSDARVAQEASAEAEEGLLYSVAAGREENLLMMPSPPKNTVLHRLPSSFEIRCSGISTAPADFHGSSSLYERHGGGLISRALGTAVHALLEELARHPGYGEIAPAALLSLQPQIAARVRAFGIDPAQASRIVAKAAEIAGKAAQDPVGRWILSPHPDAASEQRWAGVMAGALRTVQVDRVFRAGEAPMAEGESVWWLIDHKTANEDPLDKATALPKLRALFAPQLEAYAKVLRNMHGADAAVRAGLYYPRMLEFDWWEI